MFYTFIIYSLVGFFLFLILTKFSYRLNLLDVPNKRKIHSKPTAYSGGIILCIIYFIGIKLNNYNNSDFNIIIYTSFFVSIIGLIDDKFNLNFKKKLLLQTIPILYLIIFEKLILTNLGDYNYFKSNLGYFAIIFTLLCVLLLVNSFNYFDGIDGSLSFSLISVIIILYFLIPIENFRYFLLILFVPIIIFLFFNFSIFKLPKIFLGDSGSLMLGFIISFVLIYLAKQKLIHPILLAWSVAIFVYEFLSINLIRINNKKNIFRASKDHLHHILFKKNNSVILTDIIIFFINIILFIIGYFTYVLFGPFFSFILFIIVFVIFLIIRKIFN